MWFSDDVAQGDVHWLPTRPASRALKLPIRQDAERGMYNRPILVLSRPAGAPTKIQFVYLTTFTRRKITNVFTGTDKREHFHKHLAHEPTPNHPLSNGAVNSLYTPLKFQGSWPKDLEGYITVEYVYEMDWSEAEPYYKEREEAPDRTRLDEESFKKVLRVLRDQANWSPGNQLASTRMLYSQFYVDVPAVSAMPQAVATANTTQQQVPRDNTVTQRSSMRTTARSMLRVPETPPVTTVLVQKRSASQASSSRAPAAPEARTGTHSTPVHKTSPATTRLIHESSASQTSSSRSSPATKASTETSSTPASETSSATTFPVPESPASTISNSTPQDESEPVIPSADSATPSNNWYLIHPSINIRGEGLGQNTRTDGKAPRANRGPQQEFASIGLDSQWLHCNGDIKQLLRSIVNGLAHFRIARGLTGSLDFEMDERTDRLTG